MADYKEEQCEGCEGLLCKCKRLTEKAINKMKNILFDIYLGREPRD